VISVKFLPSCSFLRVELLEHLHTHLVTQELFVFKFLIDHWIFSRFKISDVNVNSVKPHWFDASLDCNSINLSATPLHFI
jgi:hypothetical protein